MVKELGKKLIAQNKKARHDFSIDDVYECGIVLMGTEVKSLRAGRASLIDGFAMVENGELWLHGVHIPEYTEGTWTNHTPRRKRKLLVHKLELRKIAADIDDNEEWVQEKIAVASAMIDSIHNYLKYKQ